MPYLDRWGITVTRISAGVYDVTLDGKTVTVHIDQQFGTETINLGAALFRAIQGLGLDSSEQWRNRRDYAFARWKLIAYQALFDAAPANQRAPLRAKRDKWVTEEQRLKALLGSDA